MDVGCYRSTALWSVFVRRRIWDASKIPRTELEETLKFWRKVPILK